MDEIIIRGAREHNLKNINLTLPKNKLVVFTGVSGSGKSSLAMDTIYAEGQRRYVESLSSYARQFLGRLEKPDVDSLEGLSPSIAIEQKTVSHNPRSTVGTVTEIYDYLRLLYARIGHPHCPKCGREISQLTVDQIVDRIIQIATTHPNFNKKRGSRVMLLAPIIRDKKGEYSQLFSNLRKDGFERVRVDGRIRAISDDFVLIKTNRHDIECVVDRIVIQTEQDETQRTRLNQSVESCLKLANGYVIASIVMDASLDFPDDPEKVEDHLFSEQFSCPYCNISLPEIEPRSFSFNSPHGACLTCSGLGSLPKIEPSLLYNPRLSVLEGGIFPWSGIAEKDSWRLRVIKAVAKDHDIDLDSPIGSLPKEAFDILFYGIGGRSSSKVQFVDESGINKLHSVKYEGIVPNLERRYENTDSEYMRTEIGKYMVKELCPTCLGSRLKPEALSVTVALKSIVEVSDLAIDDLIIWFQEVFGMENNLSKRELAISKPILKEIQGRLEFLQSVGLNYLTISRTATTLAGGESQRIRLASQIGSGLSGVIYVLDEPSIGLHDRDQERLINTLKRLRDLGNTVIVVEHDLQTILAADHLVDFGPGAGVHGGEVISEGTPAYVSKDKKSVTGPYLTGSKKVEIDKKILERIKLLYYPDFQNDSSTHPRGSLKLIGAKGHNLKNVSIEIPYGKFICITGVSGSGKSTLVNETLVRLVRQELGLKNEEKPLESDGLIGSEEIRQIISIDQSPIGRTPRSNPATYTGVFDHIRELFSMTNESKIRGYSSGRFSFNVKGGRCEACQGEGQLRIEMQFLPDVYVDCEVCGGKRYNRETLDIEYRGKNIHDVLSMNIEDAFTFFAAVPKIESKMRLLNDVGLGYLELGQSAPTLSGGEAQRIKLASELSKRSGEGTMYVLDEPTTGLHFADLQKLLGVLRLLVLRGSTVIVVEHNLDVIMNADWVIDMGPEGGHRGGEILYQGPLSDLSAHQTSHTAKSLRRHQESLGLTKE